MVSVSMSTGDLTAWTPTQAERTIGSLLAAQRPGCVLPPDPTRAPCSVHWLGRDARLTRSCASASSAALHAVLVRRSVESRHRRWRSPPRCAGHAPRRARSLARSWRRCAAGFGRRPPTCAASPGSRANQPRAIIDGYQSRGCARSSEHARAVEGDEQVALIDADIMELTTSMQTFPFYGRARQVGADRCAAGPAVFPTVNSGIMPWRATGSATAWPRCWTRWPTLARPRPCGGATWRSLPQPREPTRLRRGSRARAAPATGPCGSIDAARSTAPRAFDTCFKGRTSTTRTPASARWGARRIPSAPLACAPAARRVGIFRRARLANGERADHRRARSMPLPAGASRILADTSATSGSRAAGARQLRLCRLCGAELRQRRTHRSCSRLVRCVPKTRPAALRRRG